MPLFQYQGFVEPFGEPAPTGTASSATHGDTGNVYPIRLIQYASFVAPVAIAIAAVTTFFSPVYPSNLIKLAIKPQPALVAPIFVPDVTQAVTALSWSPEYPDRLTYRRPPEFPAYSAPNFVPDVTQPVIGIAWDPKYPSRHIYRRAAEFPQSVEPKFIPDVTNSVTPLSWTARYPDRHTYRRPVEFPALSAPNFIPDVTQVVTANSWNPTYPNKLDRKAYPAAQQQSLAWNTNTPAPVVTTDSATFGDSGFIGALRLSQYESLIGPVSIATTSQFTEWWKPALQDRNVYRRVADYRAYFAPEFVPDVTQPVRAIEWNGTYPNVLLKKTFATALHQSLAWSGFTPNPANDPSTDVSWKSAYPDRHTYRRSVEFPEPVGPSFVPDVTNLVTANSWEPKYPDRAIRKTLPTALQQALSWSTHTPAPAVDPGSVTFGDSGQIGPQVLLQYSSLFGPTSIPAPAPPFDPATSIGWNGIYPDLTRSRAGLHSSKQSFWHFDRFAAPTVIPAPDLTQPVYPNRLPAKFRLATYVWAQPMFGVEVDVPVQSWDSYTGLYHYQPQRKPVTQRQTGFNWSGFTPTPVVFDPVNAEWVAKFPDKVWPKTGLIIGAQQAFAFDRFQAPTPVIAPDLIQPVYPNRLFSKYRIGDLEPLHRIFVVPVVVPAEVWDSYTTLYPSRIDRKSRQQPTGYFSDTLYAGWSTPVVFDPQNYPDVTYPDRLDRTVTRQQAGQVGPVVIIPPTIDGWSPIYPVIVVRRVDQRNNVGGTFAPLTRNYILTIGTGVYLISGFDTSLRWSGQPGGGSNSRITFKFLIQDDEYMEDMFL